MGDVIDDGALESIWQYCGCASNEKRDFDHSASCFYPTMPKWGIFKEMIQKQLDDSFTWLWKRCQEKNTWHKQNWKNNQNSQ